MEKQIDIAVLESAAAEIPTGWGKAGAGSLSPLIEALDKRRRQLRKLISAELACHVEMDCYGSIFLCGGAQQEKERAQILLET